MTTTLSNSPALDLLLAGHYPDERGRYGEYGGRFVPELLHGAVARLEAAARDAFADPAFWAAMEREHRDWTGRPTPLTPCPRLGAAWGVRVWVKREDLAHTGAHKINNALGQAMLAKRLGTKQVIAETGAGQHGVATAAACARIGLPCRVYMGAIDVQRQQPNVFRMRTLGAEVVPVESGDRTLRSAIDEALRAWSHDPDSTYYLLGSAVGPHPYPFIVRHFQSVIGHETRRQALEQLGRLPDALFACVGGGSNAIGLFHAFLPDPGVALFGVEAGGSGAGPGQHSATMAHGRPGVLHGARSMLLQDADGQILETHSISAGLDYPGVGPEHAFLASIRRARYTTASDTEALAAVDELCRTEGIFPALEPAHALAAAKQWGRQHPGASVIVGLSGRGDKDMPILLSAGGSQ